MLPRSDGAAVTFGADGFQCQVPALPAGLRYVAAAAGGHHTVLLRSGGAAVALGAPFPGLDRQRAPLPEDCLLCKLGSWCSPDLLLHPGECG